MRKLLTMDAHNYDDSMPVLERFGVRAVIYRDGTLAMQKSRDGEYKIPGGGMEPGETAEDALLREVSEETGLSVIPSSIEPIGEITEIREDLRKAGQKFIQHSLFYRCEVEPAVHELKLTASEIEKGYTAVWATPEEIYAANSLISETGKKEAWFLRDTAFIKMILDGDVKL